MEVKTTVSTAELLPLISALKLEMQKKGYSPLSIKTDARFLTANTFLFSISRLMDSTQI